MVLRVRKTSGMVWVSGKWRMPAPSKEGSCYYSVKIWLHYEKEAVRFFGTISKFQQLVIC